MWECLFIYDFNCRMIESIGPTNTRRYKVAVYFKGERLATGTGHSIQQAEMSAACNSLEERSGQCHGIRLHKFVLSL